MEMWGRTGRRRRGGGGGVVQDTERRASDYVLSYILSKESECILRLSTFHYKFQACAVQLPTINKEPLRSRDQLVRPIRALTTLLYAGD